MDTTLLLAGLVGLLALSAKAIDFLRLVADYARDPDEAALGRILTQLLAWVAAVGVVLLYGASQFADTVEIDGLLLSDMNVATKVLVGLAIGSLASLVKDYLAARDNTDTSKFPPLL